MTKETRTYNYHFNWKDETGATVGFNDVWANTKANALKLAREMETQAHWLLWDDQANEYITVQHEVEGKGHCFRMKGMYVDEKSMYRANQEQAQEMIKQGWMMSN